MDFPLAGFEQLLSQTWRGQQYELSVVGYHLLQGMAALWVIEAKQLWIVDRTLPRLVHKWFPSRLHRPLHSPFWVQALCPQFHAEPHTAAMLFDFKFWSLYRRRRCIRLVSEVAPRLVPSLPPPPILPTFVTTAWLTSILPAIWAHLDSLWSRLWDYHPRSVMAQVSSPLSPSVNYRSSSWCCLPVRRPFRYPPAYRICPIQS